MCIPSKPGPEPITIAQCFVLEVCRVADGTFIPGGMIPGYVLIQPDFLECIDDFGFLWFEDEYTVSVAAKWVLAANAADALVK